MDWLLLLLLVMCPLMMVFMMKGHGHGGGAHHAQGIDQGHQDQLKHQVKTDENSLADYKIKQLEGKIEFLTRQNNDLQRKLENLNSKQV